MLLVSRREESFSENYNIRGTATIENRFTVKFQPTDIPISTN
jgi:hypothetical protein